MSLVEVLIAVIVIGALAAIVSRLLLRNATQVEKERPLLNLRTDVSVTLVKAQPRASMSAGLLYEVPDRWGYDLVQFTDSDLDGDLDGGLCSLGEEDPLIFSPNSKSHSEKESWDVWCQRFEEIREEAITGFKPGAKEFFQKQEEN